MPPPITLEETEESRGIVEVNISENSSPVTRGQGSLASLRLAAWRRMGNHEHCRQSSLRQLCAGGPEWVMFLGLQAGRHSGASISSIDMKGHRSQVGGKKWEP